ETFYYGAEYSKDRTPVETIKPSDGPTSTRYNDGTTEVDNPDSSWVRYDDDGTVKHVYYATGEERDFTTEDGAVTDIHYKAATGNPPYEDNWQGIDNGDGTYTYTKYDRDNFEVKPPETIVTKGPATINEKGEMVYTDATDGSVNTFRTAGTIERS